MLYPLARRITPSIVRQLFSRQHVAQPAFSEDRRQTAEFELKLPFTGHRASAILHAVETRCVEDPRYPEGWVESLYFDTLGFDLLREVHDGYAQKLKVRLRWYPDEDGAATGSARVPAWLEIKRRDGRRRTKSRRELSLLPPTRDSGESLLRVGAEVSEVLLGILPYLAPRLLPMLTVLYRRRRFIEPRSGARFAVDTEIQVSGHHPSRLRPLRRPRLDRGVVEVKGAERHLPTALGVLSALGCRTDTFSKYALCHRRFRHT